MRIRNDNNLPEPFVRAIRNSTYDPGESDATVTSLISPPQVRVLKNRYDNQIEADASDMVRSLSGSLFHLLMEQAGTEPHEIIEQRFYVNCMGWKIGGQVDLIDTQEKALYDYKETSPWAVIDGIKEEWENQLNLLDYLAANNGYVLPNLYVMVKFDGWSHTEALRNPSYPQRRVEVYPVPKWSRKEQEEFLKERLSDHQEAEINGPRPCTSEEQWRKPAKWAVYRGENKKATKLFDAQEEANEYIVSMNRPTDYYVIYRPGEATRCLYWCPVRDYCQQAIEEGNA